MNHVDTLLSRAPRLTALAPHDDGPHRLHGDGATWIEKNCYVDLWIEAVHALRMEPTALLPFTLAVDFEGDQWTFFKPPFNELWDLYGIEVQELTVWKPLLEHAREQLAAGRLICTEADAFWLPDTAATDYRQKHTKTTILIAGLDESREELAYFHNAGHFSLSGADFRGLFASGVITPDGMPLFAELVRIDRAVRRPADELAARSMQLLRYHFARRPRSNPVAQSGQRMQLDFPALQSAGLPAFHAWAFATLRQAGSAFELAAHYLRWQASQSGRAPLARAAQHFDTLAQGHKALILKGARSTSTGRPLDADALLGDMARAWDQGMEEVGAVL